MKSPENENALNEYGNIPALKEIIEERKEKAVSTLSASYAKNRLPLEEYERLVEYINKIESERELIIVEKIAAEYNGKESANKASQPVFYDDEDETNYPDYGLNNSMENLTVLSNRTFQGPVKSGSQFVSILGTEQIIIRRADLRSGQTVLNVVSIFGDSTVLVEPGIRVTNRAIPILGNCETKFKDYKDAYNDKELIVSGAAIFGNITIKQLK
jgi:hypothetical protein